MIPKKIKELGEQTSSNQNKKHVEEINNREEEIKPRLKMYQLSNLDDY